MAAAAGLVTRLLPANGSLHVTADWLADPCPWPRTIGSRSGKSRLGPTLWSPAGRSTSGRRPRLPAGRVTTCAGAAHVGLSRRLTPQPSPPHVPGAPDAFPAAFSPPSRPRSHRLLPRLAGVPRRWLDRPGPAAPPAPRRDAPPRARRSPAYYSGSSNELCDARVRAAARDRQSSGGGRWRRSGS